MPSSEHRRLSSWLSARRSAWRSSPGELRRRRRCGSSRRCRRSAAGSRSRRRRGRRPDSRSTSSITTVVVPTSIATPTGLPVAGPRSVPSSASMRPSTTRTTGSELRRRRRAPPGASRIRSRRRSTDELHVPLRPLHASPGRRAGTRRRGRPPRPCAARAASPPARTSTTHSWQRPVRWHEAGTTTASSSASSNRRRPGTSGRRSDPWTTSGIGLSLTGAGMVRMALGPFPRDHSALSRPAAAARRWRPLVPRRGARGSVRPEIRSPCARSRSPRYDRLTPADCARLHDASVAILERTGVRMRRRGGGRAPARRGARVSDDGRVFVPGSLVEWALARGARVGDAARPVRRTRHGARGRQRVLRRRLRLHAHHRPPHGRAADGAVLAGRRSTA